MRLELIHGVTHAPVPLRGSAATFALDVREGLSARGQKRVPSRYLYDALGSALFEAICALPQYGVSRAGERLIVRHGAELRSQLHGPLHVVELGGGSGRKLRMLLERLGTERIASVSAIDLSATALEATRAELRAFSGLNVETFTTSFRWGLRQAAARRARGERLLVVFLGGNLGNYERDEARDFLRDIHMALLPGDALLLGLDLVKPAHVLLSAYDDPLGVTAAFDKNLLERMNRELGAGFELDGFEHEARWNAAQKRIEMHLRSKREQLVSIPAAELDVTFAPGETIWTESSHKFERTELVALGAQAAFELRAQWIDPEWAFVHALYACSARDRGLPTTHLSA